MRTNATKEELNQALVNLNKSKGYKIEFNRFDQKGKYIHFTLKSKSGISGARYSWSGRNLAAASWHAHGFFFEELFKVNPNAFVIALGKQRIDINDGNWQDRNIGSRAFPCKFSSTSIL